MGQAPRTPRAAKSTAANAAVADWLRQQQLGHVTVDELRAVASVVANVSNGHASPVSYLTKRQRRTLAGAAKEVKDKR